MIKGKRLNRVVNLSLSVPNLSDESIMILVRAIIDRVNNRKTKNS